MDAQVLKTFRDVRGLDELKKLMKPQYEIKDLISCRFKELLEMNLNEVENLFKVEGNVFTVRHESNLVISKFQCGVRGGKEWEVRFEMRNVVECGINYLGVLRVNGVGVRVLGAGSYDPASIEPYLTRQDYVVITGCWTMALYALKFGGEEAFGKIFKIFESNKACKTHKMLVEFMKYQIYEGVIKRNHIKGYGRFLQENFRGEDALRKENEDLVMYLNLFEMYTDEEMLPSKRFMVELERVEGEAVALADVVKFIRNNESEIYLVPDQKFVKELAGRERDEDVFDLRMMGKRLNGLQEKYSSRLSQALGNRNDRADVRVNEVKELVKPYANCVLF